MNKLFLTIGIILAVILTIGWMWKMVDLFWKSAVLLLLWLIFITHIKDKK